MAMLKCSNCQKLITSFKLVPLDASELGATVIFNAVALCCGWCDHVYGAQLDPIAIKTDIINGVAQRLGR